MADVPPLHLPPPPELPDATRAAALANAVDIAARWETTGVVTISKLGEATLELAEMFERYLTGQEWRT